MTWCWSWSPGWDSVSIPHSYPSYCTLWKVVKLCAAEPEEWGVCSSFLKGNSVHILFGIFLHGRCVFFALFINLLSHLFVSLWAYGYLFYNLGYNPVLHHFVATLTSGSSLKLAPLLLSSIHFYRSFCCWKHFHLCDLAWTSNSPANLTRRCYSYLVKQ